ncbi:substrate-binding domain-containing protein [Streptosporangium sp. NPDC001681]|uniref:substrate-binding domain-containing protein n=1 Tax=Streptosporangium sp. NPDC001681 TaxID=3154395 RepID=UPI00331899C2
MPAPPPQVGLQVEHPATTFEAVQAGSDAQQTRHSVPAITALDLAPENSGKAAVELLIARLNGETAPGPIILPAKLRGRASTGDA